MTFKSNKINLPKFVMIKFRDKCKIRHMMKREPLLFHIMLKQGITWFTLASNTQENVQDNIDTFPEWISTSRHTATLTFTTFTVPSQKTQLTWR